MVNKLPFIPAIKTTEKKNSFFMAKHSYTLSDKVLYDDASLYIAKEGEKLYFNFKKNPMVETYNVLEAVAILINDDKYSKLPIWNIQINDDDRQIDAIAPVFYWLCHTYDIENILKLEWPKYCEHIVIMNKSQLLRILHESNDLSEIRNGIIRELNYDKMYSQLLRFIV